MSLDDSTLTIVKEMAESYAREYLPGELPYFSLIWEQVHQQRKDGGDFTARDAFSALRLPFAAGRKLQIVTPQVIMTIEATLLDCGELTTPLTDAQTQEAIAKCAEVYGLSKRKAQQMGKRMAKSLNNMISQVLSGEDSMSSSDDHSYIVWTSPRDGAGALRCEVSVNELTNEYLSTKKQKAYDIFVDRLKVLVKLDGKHELWPLSETYTRMLVIFLTNKDRTVYANLLEEKAIDVNPKLSAADATLNSASERLRKAVQRLKKDSIYQQFKRFVISDKGEDGSYMCTGDFNFCVVMDKAIEDQFVFPAE